MDELVQKAKKGDSSAFYLLVEGKLDMLYRIAYSYFKDKEAASDAVQDSLLAAYKSIKSLKEPSKFNSWLTSILVNRCRDILRRQKKANFEEYKDEVASHTIHRRDEYSAVDASIDISNSLKLLDQKYRDVILLKYIGECTISEISGILNIPEGTVKSRLNYGLNKLKGFMEVRDDGMHLGIR